VQIHTFGMHDPVHTEPYDSIFPFLSFCYFISLLLSFVSFSHLRGPCRSVPLMSHPVA
jgi:hypothetical protein